MSPEPNGSSPAWEADVCAGLRLLGEDVPRPLKDHLARGHPCKITGVWGSVRTCWVSPARGDTCT